MNSSINPPAMTTYDPTLSPHAIAKTEVTVAFDMALRAPTFLDFIRNLRAHGIEFVQRGKNPVLHLGTNRFRLATLGLLPDLREAFMRWEGFKVTFQINNLEALAIQFRLQWMACTCYRHDVPEGVASLMSITYRLGVERVANAMSITFAKPGLDDDSQRFRYFCGVCWQMIREQPAAHAWNPATTFGPN